MAAKHFSSQNKSSYSERDSLTPCNMHMTPCNMQKILHGYSSASEWETFQVYNKPYSNDVNVFPIERIGNGAV